MSPETCVPSLRPRGISNRSVPPVGPPPFRKPVGVPGGTPDEAHQGMRTEKDAAGGVEAGEPSMIGWSGH